MQAKQNKASLWETIKSKYAIFLVLVVLFVICTFLNSNFLTWGNLTNISRQISVTTILAFGETILIISGLLDLSSGAVMAFAGTLSVMCYKAMGEGAFSMIVAILVAIAIAMFCNALNALMVTTFKAPAFIVTLAMQTMAAGDYATAIQALESVSRQNASEAYADMERMYQEANYLYANQLYDGKKPYEALPYYRNIPDYKDVARKLDRVCYRMLGIWVSVTGIHMEFREDGTCTLDGRSYYFYATQFAFFTGDKPDQLRTEWTIHSCTAEALSIQNNKTNIQYKLTRVAE